MQMRMTLKSYTLYSFLVVLILYSHDVCDSIPLNIKLHHHNNESSESFRDQVDTAAQQHQFNIYDKLQNNNCVEDTKAAFTTEVLHCILISTTYSYYYPTSDYIFIKKLLLINKSPPFAA